MTVADTLGLKANTKVEKRLLDYLNENCSDMLAFKIQAGTKTIQGALKYIQDEVRKTIDKGKQKGAMCVMVEDEEVFGMLIHYFEEDEIKEDKKAKKKTESKPSTAKARDADHPKAEEPKEDPGQCMMFDIFEGEERPF